LRKAIGKKNREAMARLKPAFFDGCRASGTGEQLIEHLWNTNEKSADYSFNKSHAACYALIAYRTAWLKANFCAEYMAALISSVMSTKDKVPFFVQRCEEMGIEILPPDVNESDHEFVVIDGNIRFGLDAVKGVGYAAVEAIKDARAEGGPFTSIWDFCERVDCRCVNKKAIEALVKAGAFGSTGASRKGMLMVLEQAQGAGQKKQQDAELGQASFFDLGGDPAGGAASAFSAPAHPPIPSEEFEQHDLLAHEKEAIGLFLSTHPLKEVRDALHEAVDKPLRELDSCKDGDWLTVGGMITEARRIKTRAGKTMMFAKLSDLDAEVDLLIFEDQILEYEQELQVDSIVLVRGQLDHGDRGTCVKPKTVERFDPTPEDVERAREKAAKQATGPLPLRLCLDATGLAASVIEDLKHVLGNFPGESDVVLDVVTSAGPRVLRFGPEYRVAPTISLRSELQRILGPAALSSAAPEQAPAAAQAASAS
ncbi:MAG TPA: OB-fold nucleic acid binding domain-containing protein, partial [Baekduia sp.]|nr:OB-fold nucleic acid binding domain-containing protein [Baekduia sp.]